MIGEKTIIPADVITKNDIALIMRRANELKYSNLRKRLSRTGKGGE